MKPVHRGGLTVFLLIGQLGEHGQPFLRRIPGELRVTAQEHSRPLPVGCPDQPADQPDDPLPAPGAPPHP
jgi:hypothetical protein